MAGASEPAQSPTPETTLVVVLGASRYPRLAEWDNPVLGTSAADLRAYVGSTMAVPDAQVLDLFDDPAPAASQCARIEAFLAGHGAARDLIVYYIGHGAFDEADYYLGVADTTEHRIFITALESRKLARLIRECFARKRVYVILDACFAASAATDWQSTALDAAVRGMAPLPRRGTALLAAASKDRVAHAPRSQRHTVFTGALLGALARGVRFRGEKLSLVELFEEIQAAIEDQAAELGRARPELHAPRQDDGDVSRLPLFPNAAWRAAREASARREREAEARRHREPFAHESSVVISLAELRGAPDARDTTLPEAGDTTLPDTADTTAPDPSDDATTLPEPRDDDASLGRREAWRNLGWLAGLALLAAGLMIAARRTGLMPAPAPVPYEKPVPVAELRRVRDDGNCLPLALRDEKVAQLVLGRVEPDVVVCSVDLTGTKACWSVQLVDGVQPAGTLTKRDAKPLPGRDLRVLMKGTTADGFTVPRWLRPPDGIVDVARSWDGKRAAMLVDETVRFYEAESGRYLDQFPVRRGAAQGFTPHAVHWLPDHLLLEVTDDPGYAVWKVNEHGGSIGLLETSDHVTRYPKEGTSLQLLDSKHVAIAEPGFAKLTVFNLENSVSKVIDRDPEARCLAGGKPGEEVETRIRCAPVLARSVTPWIGAQAIQGPDCLLVLLRGNRLGELAVADPNTLEELRTIQLPWCAP